MEFSNSTVLMRAIASWLACGLEKLKAASAALDELIANLSFGGN